MQCSLQIRFAWSVTRDSWVAGRPPVSGWLPQNAGSLPPHPTDLRRAVGKHSDAP